MKITKKYLWLTLLISWGASAELVQVRHTEGELHGFVVLRTLDGAEVAEGEAMQETRGGTVTNRLVFHFKDGSTQDETVVYSQRGHFQMLSDHIAQKGPAFKRPLDLSINRATGMVTVRYTEDKGGDKTTTSHLNLPPDLANGMVATLLKNLGTGVQSITVPMIVATPKPLLVKLVIHAEGEDLFTAGGANHKATRYVVKVDIGGVRGVLAPLVGKQPPDTHVWILGGSFPMFLKSEGPSYEGGPIWRTELVSPVGPKGS